MLRHVGYACLVVGFVVVGYYGVAGWANRSGTHGSDAAAPEDASPDETPLSFRHLNREEMHKEAAKGYPWPTLREIVPMYKRDLPPDLGDPSAEDATKRVSNTLGHLYITMPSGRLTWAQIVAALRERFEPEGVKVLTGPEKFAPPEGFTLEIPQSPRWSGIQIVSYMYVASQQAVGYQVCSEGVCVGTNAAVNYEMREALLIENRRRVSAERTAPVLDAEFRPDLVDATVGSLANVVQAQTGVDLVADTELWDTGTCIRWRGEPRKLRDALDKLCVGLHAYWRYRDGRVWLLRP